MKRREKPIMAAKTTSQPTQEQVHLCTKHGPTRNRTRTWIVGLIDRVDKYPVAVQVVVAELAVLVEVLGHGTRQRHHGTPVVLDRLRKGAK
jgi:hypothetical protein